MLTCVCECFTSGGLIPISEATTIHPVLCDGIVFCHVCNRGQTCCVVFLMKPEGDWWLLKDVPFHCMHFRIFLFHWKKMLRHFLKRRHQPYSSENSSAPLHINLNDCVYIWRLSDTLVSECVQVEVSCVLQGSSIYWWGTLSIHR